jgi:glutathione synthase/RimK-type ligase-like ATP-grasp enzyme
VWAVWDDPYVDWSAAPLVHVRSTWDYQTRLPDFLGWAHAVGPRLLHGVEAFRWNTDKSYLADLAGRGTVPVVPTVLAESIVDLRVAAAGFGAAVVKPRVGASGIGVHVVADPETWLPSDAGPWVVQPLLGSVQHEGELSVFVIGGHPVSQVRKVAGRDDIRVHEEHGGTTTAVPLTDEAALLAVDAVAATTEILGTELVCARVDLLRDDAGTLLVSEVEITEPGLYLDVVPANGEALAAALAAHLA